MVAAVVAVVAAHAGGSVQHSAATATTASASASATVLGAGAWRGMATVAGCGGGVASSDAALEGTQPGNGCWGGGKGGVVGVVPVPSGGWVCTQQQQDPKSVGFCHFCSAAPFTRALGCWHMCTAAPLVCSFNQRLRARFLAALRDALLPWCTWPWLVAARAVAEATFCVGHVGACGGGGMRW